jgi:hypothetical protein
MRRFEKDGRRGLVVFDREKVEEIRRFGNEPDLPDEGPSVVEINPIDPDLPTVGNQSAAQQF